MEWHWYRLEYQARGSTHAHVCVKLKNDPGICTFVTKAAAAWISSELRPGSSVFSLNMRIGNILVKVL